MKTFNLNLKWKSECEGTVEVVAETLEEAMEKVNKDKNHYLRLSEYGYIGFKEVSEIQEITENPRLTKECVIKDVTYVSIWDDGNKKIETSAKYNVTTGEIFDIESYSGDELEDLTTLDEEYIVLEEGNKYVLSVKNSEKKVTEDYVLNVYEEGRYVFGDNLYLLYRESDNEMSLIYGDECNSFIYGEETFEVKSGAPVKSLINLFRSNSYEVEEE